MARSTPVFFRTTRSRWPAWTRPLWIFSSLSRCRTWEAICFNWYRFNPTAATSSTFKFDHRINDKQTFSAYYYFTDDTTPSRLPIFSLAGANVPGFGSVIAERFQQWNISHTWTISNSSVNEFRFNYNREAQRTFQHPQTTSLVQDSCPTAPSWLTSVTGPVPCFSDGTPANDTGIHPGLGPTREGVAIHPVSGGFNLGNNAEGELPQVGNSFQWSDNLTKVSGNHTFKFGGDLRRQRFDQTLYFNVSGEYFYFGGGPTNDPGASNLFPNFLLGLPDSVRTGFGTDRKCTQYIHLSVRSGQLEDQAESDLELRLRWELNTPITDIGQHVQTFRPGQSTQFIPVVDTGSTDCASQCSRLGLVVPGDTGVPMADPDLYKAFAPRIGIAWSPGKSGKTSIRAGWGLFYNPIEQLVLEQFSAEPPFGGSIFICQYSIQHSVCQPGWDNVPQPV